jgi:hypothetical protein
MEDKIEMKRIIFYRTKNCKGCDFIQQSLDNLVVDYRLEVLSDAKDLDKMPPGVKPPAIIWGDDIVRGTEKIVEYLDRFSGFKEEWEKFQGDSCYCDE